MSELFSPEALTFSHLRGSSVRPEELSDLVWSGVACQFMAVQRSSGRNVGLVSLAKLDNRTQTAFLNVTFASDYWKDGRSVHAIVLFVNYVFVQFSLRRLYIEVPSYRINPVATAVARHFVSAGALLDYEFFQDEFHDLAVHWMGREHWLRSRVRYLDAVGAIS